MPTATRFAETIVSQSQDYAPTVTTIIATACLIWYAAVAFVCSVGFLQLYRHYSSPPRAASLRDGECPDATIIRPIKGLEPRLYDCLASTFRQDYPKDKLHVRLCIASRDDPSYPIVQRLVGDFESYDVQLLVEDEDNMLKDGTINLGPNPKIRNMSRAYREAVGDFIWIIDCNIWVARGVCRRLVSTLEGRGTKHKNKFVHQLPLSIDVQAPITQGEDGGLLDANSTASSSEPGPSVELSPTLGQPISAIGGSRLDEQFLSSAHAKFYTAINTVSIAPCIVGKSTMFRRSHLNDLTDGRGIDYFSENICEDHLIGDRIWKHKISEERNGVKYGKHVLCLGDLAIQPVSNMSISDYWNRRVRWLRVRKFTVTLATFVEPGTECFLCSIYGAFAVTTLPVFGPWIPQTWSAFAAFWLVSTSLWCYMDWLMYLLLQSGASIAVDEDTPSFARPPVGGHRRPFSRWIFAWLGREALAFPIWFWAFWGGTTVEWRGKHFWVGTDMKVHEIKNDTGIASVSADVIEPVQSKARLD